MSEDGVGHDRKAFQQLVDRPVGSQDRLEGALHPPEPLLRFPALFLGKDRPWEDEVTGNEVSRVLLENPVDGIEVFSHLGKVHAQIGHHADVLASFPWKQERQLRTRNERLLRVIDPLNVPELLPIGIRKSPRRFLKLLFQVGQVGGDDGEPGGAVG